MFTLPPLPYAETALAPVISANTLSFHYGKHHKAYVDNLNNLAKGTEYESASLEKIIRDTAGKPDKTGLFNNAAQVWNHTFYWSCLKGGAGGKPTGRIAQLIDSDLGGYDAFKKEFATACTTQFGSGWGWLVFEGGKLRIVKTPNAEVPFTKGATPLLTIDVWEHAYYLDYQNRRPDYSNAVIDKLLNWDFATENLARA
ncbi:MAG: superoxide dismutase [Casimicrobiaceae bacterium]|nr:superoxide dismutase [Pseudomonadota bacterium]